MDANSLNDLAEQLLERAQKSSNGRAAHTVYGGQGHHLRQTVIVLLAGQELADHESPGESTLQVLRGRVSLKTHSEAIEGTAGDLMVIPPERHSLGAPEESVVLLTVLVS